MNRKIKFRAWNKHQEVMVYEDEDDRSSYWDGVHANSVDLINKRFFMEKDVYIWMQYTNLNDVDGKDVYEGDILEDNKHGYLHLVKFEPEMSGFVCVNQATEVHAPEPLDYVTNEKNGVIVGNKFEDSNLLEG